MADALQRAMLERLMRPRLGQGPNARPSFAPQPGPSLFAQYMQPLLEVAAENGRSAPYDLSQPLPAQVGDRVMAGLNREMPDEAVTMLPGVGDVADIYLGGKQFAQEPTWTNAAIAGLAALPMVPFAAAGTIAGKGAKTAAKRTLADIEDAARRSGIDLSLSQRGDQITVNKIVVPKSFRNQGVGSKTMQDLADFADANQKTLALTPSSDFGGSKKRLERFYKRFGFESNRGRGADHAISETMRRYPSAPTPEASKPTIRAYHGSPHDFDQFDLSKIGTGEGAQAYGHGLYFAEREDVAKGYRDGLLAARNEPQGLRVRNTDIEDLYARLDRQAARKPFPAAQAEYDKMAMVELLMQEGDVPSVLRRIEDYPDNFSPAAAEWFKREVAPNFSRNGRMYEVNINADPEDFLDWDKPLREQPDAFYAGMKAQDKRFMIVAPDGKSATNIPLTKAEADEFISDFRRGYSRHGGDPNDWRIADYSEKSSLPNLPLYETFNLRDPQGASAMAETGIPGIKYLDQGSRAAGEGSRNYVVFDDKLIEILRKYGLSGLLAGTGAAGLVSILESGNGNDGL